ncbi:MAG: DUF4426 domain-containing protein, partial [Gammaproteobacteria bacterium]
SLGLAVVWLGLAACGGGGGDIETVDRVPPARILTDASSKDFGNYVLHFNALTTDQLTPAVAKQYGIVRSKNRAMLNVSIVRKDEGTTGQSVPGNVSASASNLTGQQKNLQLREIKSAGAVYYIGDVDIANRETLVFNVSATPENEGDEFSVRFTRQFFSD